MSDGSIHIDTKIDQSSLKPQLASMKSNIASAFASMRDVMQGPVMVGRMVVDAFRKIGAEVARLENEWAASEEALAILNSTLKATGATAWTSSEAIQDMASEFQSMTKYGDETIVSMANVLLGFKNIKGDNFKEASLQILNMATVMKMDLTSAAQAVGKALDDPINGIDSLSRQGFRFTQEQKTMLKTMVQTGDIAGAQRIILDELATTYGGAAEAAGQTGTAIKTRLANAVGDLNEEIGRSITGSLTPFRKWLLEIAEAAAKAAKAQNDFRDAVARNNAGIATNADKLMFAKQQLADYKQAMSEASVTGGYFEGASGADAFIPLIAATEAEIKALESLMAAEDAAAKARTDSEKKAADAAAVQARADARQAEITKARADAVTAYNEALRKIAIQEQTNSITAKEADALRAKALEDEIDALTDLAAKYGLAIDSHGATIDLLKQEIALREENNKTIQSQNELMVKGANTTGKEGTSRNVSQPDKPIESELSSFFGIIKDAMGGLVSSISALANVQKILNPLQTIINAIMDVLGPVINELLSPLVGILEIVGKTIGAVLAPALQILQPVIEVISAMFIFLYNKVIRPVANFMIIAFNKIRNGFAGFINAILDMIDAIPFVNLSFRVGTVSEDAGTLAEITTTTSDYSDAVDDANKELAENKKLFTLASKAGEAYNTVLEGVVKTASSFYDGLKDIGSDLASTIIDSLTSGFDNDDFLYALEEYIRNAVIRAAVFTDSFMAQVSQIGAKLATAIATGDTSSIAAIKNQLASLYANAAAAANAATEAVSGAFGSYAVGTLGLPSDGLIYAHAGEAVIPSGLMSEAMARGLTIAPTAALMAGAQNVTVNLRAALNVDGRAMAGVVFKYQDELVGAAYGA